MRVTYSPLHREILIDGSDFEVVKIRIFFDMDVVLLDFDF